MARRAVPLILLISLLGFGIRLAAVYKFVGFTSPPSESANPDQIDYEIYAWNMASGNGYAFEDGSITASRPPGTSFTLLPVYWVFGRSFAAARIWMCLLGAATIAVAGLVAMRAFGPTSGIWAAALLAINPGHFYYSLHFISEVPFGLYLIAAIYFGMLATDRHSAWGLASGLFWGMTILTRPNLALGVATVVAVWLVMAGPWRERILRTGLLTAGCLALLLPWVARNYVVFGKASLCTVVGAYTFWGAHNDRVATEPQLLGMWIETSSLADADHPIAGTELEREKAAWSYGKEWVLANLDKMPRLTLYKLWRLVAAFPERNNRMADLFCRLGWYLLAPWVAAGIVLSLKRDWSRAMVLLSPVIATFATAVIFYGCSRFREGVLPVLVCFGGLAIAELTAWLADRASLRSTESTGQLLVSTGEE